LYRDEKDPGHFIVIEEWPDRAALDAHCASEQFTRLIPLVDQYTRNAAQYILMDAQRWCPLMIRSSQTNSLAGLL